MAKSPRAATAVATLAIGALAAAPLSAQLLNGGFDGGLDGWTIGTSSGFQAQWLADDAQGSPISGSVQIGDGNPGTNAAARVLFQCLQVAAGEPIPYGASARVFAEGEPGVEAWLLTVQFDNASCDGEASVIDALTVNDGDEAWQSAAASLDLAGAHIQSVQLGLAIRKPIGSGIGGLVRYDDVFFGEAAISLSRWTIDAGGGSASGGGIELRGATLGQPDAGSASAGSLVLHAGFWSGHSPVVTDRIFANDFELP